MKFRTAARLLDRRLAKWAFAAGGAITGDRVSWAINQTRTFLLKAISGLTIGQAKKYLLARKSFAVELFKRLATNDVKSIAPDEDEWYEPEKVNDDGERDEKMAELYDEKAARVGFDDRDPHGEEEVTSDEG